MVLPPTPEQHDMWARAPQQHGPGGGRAPRAVRALIRRTAVRGEDHRGQLHGGLQVRPRDAVDFACELQSTFLRPRVGARKVFGRDLQGAPSLTRSTRRLAGRCVSNTNERRCKPQSQLRRLLAAPAGIFASPIYNSATTRTPATKLRCAALATLRNSFDLRQPDEELVTTARVERPASVRVRGALGTGRHQARPVSQGTTTRHRGQHGVPAGGVAHAGDRG